MTFSFARRALTILPLLSLPLLGGCAADASGTEGSEATESDLTIKPLPFPVPQLKCFMPDFSGPAPWEGYHATLISRDAATAPSPTIGSRWTGCPVSLSFDQLQIGTWGGKAKAQLNVGSWPTKGSAYMDLTVYATRNVSVFTNGQWTTSTVSEKVYSGTIYPVDVGSPSFTPPMYYTHQFDLPNGYDTLSVSVNSYQTYLVGPHGGPSLPAVSALPVEVSLFFL